MASALQRLLIDKFEDNNCSFQKINIDALKRASYLRTGLRKKKSASGFHTLLPQILSSGKKKLLLAKKRMQPFHSFISCQVK